MAYQTDTSLPPREQVRRALASGEFEQYTGGALEGPEGRLCCHGVACIVAEQNGIEIARGSGETTISPTGYLRGGALSHTQVPVFEWLGLTIYAEDDRIRWNDTGGLTFEEIALRY